MDEVPQSIRVIDRESCKPPKCYFRCEQDVVDWILQPLSQSDRDKFTAFEPATIDKDGKLKHANPRHKSFDCSIMDVADDIAYGVHDLEDAIAMGLVTERDFRAAVTDAKSGAFLNALKHKYPSESQNDVYETFLASLFGGGRDRKHYISRLVHHFVTNIEIIELTDFDEPLIRFRAALSTPQRQFLDALQALIVDKVIKSAEVQHLEFKGQKMVISVFEALMSDPKALLPADAYAEFEHSNGDVRVICDHVAGMTDSFLLKTYDRLFSPRMGSVFDKL
jgi:dGTPase